MNAQYPYLLILKEGPSTGKTYPLEGEEILIGREPDCTLQIDSSGISRRHAQIISKITSTCSRTWGAAMAHS